MIGAGLRSRLRRSAPQAGKRTATARRAGSAALLGLFGLLGSALVDGSAVAAVPVMAASTSVSLATGAAPVVAPPAAPTPVTPARDESPSSLAAWQAQLDAIVHDGFDRPEAALVALMAIKPPTNGGATDRGWWLAVGLVQAADGRAVEAKASADQLAGIAKARDDTLAAADADLVRAALADNAGQLEAAANAAQHAQGVYDRLCGEAAATPRPDCDYRARWLALQLLANRATAQGVLVNERNDWQAALDIAHKAEDLPREAFSLTQLALAHARASEFDMADRLLAQAARLAHLSGSAELSARVKIVESLTASYRADEPAARRAIDEGLRLAEQARSPRLQAIFLANLSDKDVKDGHPQAALDAIERALPIVRSHHDARRERTLLHNAVLARIGLHQLAGAKQDIDRMLVLWQQRGENDEAQALREFSDALAAAGDDAGALDLFHRERKLAADIMARNRDSSLAELQARNDREAKQRSIELLERDNALKTAQIANRSLLQRIWTLLAVTFALAVAFAVLLYLRVRETQRQLEQSHDKLRVQSERDALTGLANRRAFQNVMRERQAHAAFEGALLLVDIDHFKHVNDGHGHAAGDEVLVEVARRLADAVRSDDMVVRWGGEEFLVYAPRLDAGKLDAFADRLLHAVGGSAVTCADASLRITASIGHAHFPLAPQRLRMGWERAVNLADMALYTAKSLGRNRAVGIVSVPLVIGADALRTVEEDFERAWGEGRVELRVTEGP